MIDVTLPPNYCARHVKLEARQFGPRTWRVVAVDDNGYVAEDVTVDGERLPASRSQAAAQGRINSLGAAGLRLWATPVSRTPSCFITPTIGAGYQVMVA